MFLKGLGRGFGDYKSDLLSGPFAAPAPPPQVLEAYSGPGEGVWSSPEVIPTDPNAPIESIRNPDNPVRLILQSSTAAEVQSILDDWEPVDGMTTLDVDPTVLQNLRAQVLTAADVITGEIDAGRHTPLVVADPPAGSASVADTATLATTAAATEPALAAAASVAPLMADSMIPGVPNVALYAAGGLLVLLMLRR